jgi:hypothetical protein
VYWAGVGDWYVFVAVVVIVDIIIIIDIVITKVSLEPPIMTALPLVREAKRRGFRIVVIDPNVHGDAQGYNTFRKTMDFVLSDQCFGGGRQPPLVYMCHSASGGHMARHLLEAPAEDIHNIQAVAFTDSTHSVQWAKTNQVLHDFLQSPKCVYFRSSREQDGVDVNKWYLHAAGQPVQTDSFWVHRFGTIRTLWAGTNEHSLTNWFAHAKIWEHFDSLDDKRVEQVESDG